MRLILALTAALAATAVLAGDLPDPAPVVAAERAFAADTARIGVDRGFLKHSADDAIAIGATVDRVHATLDANAPEAPPNPSLVWFPLWAGISKSGDLGFTSGPVDIGGQRRFTYFTIWQKQTDGTWKWVYDGGVGANSRDDPGPETPVVYLATATVGSASPEAAMTEVRAMEATLAAKASIDQKAAHLAAFAPDSRLHVAPHPPGRTPEAVAALLDSYPPTFRFAPMGGGASQAGDLAWTYGTAGWAKDGADRNGHYVRIWQKRPGGWKLVFAQLLPAPPPPQPAPPAT